MNLRQAAQQALEAMDKATRFMSDSDYKKLNEAIAALRAALAEPEQARSLTDELMDCVDRLGSEADTVDPRVWHHLLVYAPKPEQEPVAWMLGDEVYRVKQCRFFSRNPGEEIPGQIPLYTAPTPRKPLTDEEVRKHLAIAKSHEQTWLMFARAIERAHGIKEQEHE